MYGLIQSWYISAIASEVLLPYAITGWLVDSQTLMNLSPIQSIAFRRGKKQKQSQVPADANSVWCVTEFAHDFDVDHHHGLPLTTF